MERTDADLVRIVLAGDSASFESLVVRYQGRVFATARRYARRESEVEDIVQEVFLKAFEKLATFRGEAPFEHWLMRLAVRTCYDHLRRHQRNRELTFTDLSPDEADWLGRVGTTSSEDPGGTAAAARELIWKVLETLPPPARLVITLLEIEDRPVREVAQLTGWSETLVKVRAFRARRLLRRALETLAERGEPGVVPGKERV